MDAGVAGFEDAQNAQCATFYGAGCALYQDLFTDLTPLRGSPTPPPPPLPPLGLSADMTGLRPERIFFAMGPSAAMATSLVLPGESDALAQVPYRKRDRLRHLQSADADGEGVEILDASDDPLIIDACSKPEAGTTLSLCETNGYENAWIMYDLGAEFDLRAVRLTTYKVRRAPVGGMGGWQHSLTIPTLALSTVWHPSTRAAAAALPAAAAEAALARPAAAEAARAAPAAPAPVSIPLHRLGRHGRLLRQVDATGQQWNLRGRRRGEHLECVRVGVCKNASRTTHAHMYALTACLSQPQRSFQHTCLCVCAKKQNRPGRLPTALRPGRRLVRSAERVPKP